MSLLPKHFWILKSSMDEIVKLIYNLQELNNIEL